MKLLLATNNKSKKIRFEKIAKGGNLDIQFFLPSELGIDLISTPEEGNLHENAEEKARAYLGKTELPILSGDTGFFVDGQNFDPVKVKRNALFGLNEDELTQDEIAEKMIDFYQSIAKKAGGEVPAYFLDVWVLLLPTGKILIEESKRPCVLTDKVKDPIDIHFPLRSLYKSNATNKYSSETSEEEYLLEVQPITEALKKLVSGR